MGAETLSHSISAEKEPRRLVEIYRELTLEADAGEFNYSPRGARDLKEFYEDPKVFSLNREAQHPYESDEFCAKAEDISTYYAGGRQALYKSIAEERAQRLGVDAGGLPEADKEEAALFANNLTNLIKLRQEGHTGKAGDDLSTYEGYEDFSYILQPEHIEIFQAGAAQSLGGEGIGERKAKDITATLEGHFDSVSRGVGLNLFAAIQYERMDRINQARNILEGKNHAMNTGRFRPPAFVAQEDAEGIYMRSKYGRVIDPASTKHSMHKPGDPTQYQPRLVTEASDKLKDGVREALVDSREVIKETALKAGILRGAVKKAKDLRERREASRMPKARRRKL